MNPRREYHLLLTRRQLFGRAATGVGTAALASLLNPAAFAASSGRQQELHGALGKPHFGPRAKHGIYLHQSGGPSHLDLFDWKPRLGEHYGVDLPASVRMGQRITGMTSGQKTLPVAPSIFKFAQHGRNGQWLSEL